MSKESLCSLTGDARPHCPTCCRINQALAAAKSATPMFRQPGGRKKTEGFGRPFEWQAHVEPADPVGSAAGIRGALGLLPYQWGIELH